MAETPLEGVPLDSVKVERSENDWMVRESKDGKFRANCGPMNLSEVVEIFRAWCLAQSGAGNAG